MTTDVFFITVSRQKVKTPWKGLSHWFISFKCPRELLLSGLLKRMFPLLACVTKKRHVCKKYSSLAAHQNLYFNWTPMGRRSFVSGLGFIVNFVCLLFSQPIPRGLPRAARSPKKYVVSWCVATKKLSGKHKFDLLRVDLLLNTEKNLPSRKSG